MQTVAVLWLVAAVWLNVIGWTLAALHQLNPTSYALALLPGIFWAFVWLNKNPPVFRRQTFSRRFRRPLPAIFLLVTSLIFFGGLWYAPSNFDALTYRLPRMLNWLVAEKWFWIPAFNDRMNCANTAWEWTAMPLLALTRSDRGMFLINAIGFILLPGLLFAILRQLGVARRVAWTWMWLLPLAYGCVTQAGSVGNDLTGAVFCLLAIYFGLRARGSGRASEVWLAGLATALMTGVKVSNLPLVLPCLVAMWPALGLLRKHFIGSLAVGAMAVIVSAAPMMVLNQRHTGSWSGDPQDQYQMQIKNPVAAVIGNGVLLAEQSFMPPVLPGSVRFNEWLVRGLPDSLKAEFPRLSQNKLNELPGEEGAGLGLGITLPLLMALGVSAGRVRGLGSFQNVFSLLPPVALGAWLAALFFVAKIGSEAGPRLLLPYYFPVIIPFLLLPVQREWLRFRAWRIFLGVLALGVLPVLVLSVARPLWPAQFITTQMAAAHPDHKMLQRLASTYTAYAHRNDVLGPVREVVPDDVREIGFIAGSNDADYSLWRPFGRRKVIYLRHDLRQFLENPSVQWVVVKQDVWPELSPISLETWSEAHHAKIVTSLPIVELVSWGPENWCVLRLTDINSH